MKYYDPKAHILFIQALKTIEHSLEFRYCQFKYYGVFR